ncbi:multisubunit sodium/proton antiporter, MrpA subunit /multisubunit sodium/proton antiporter, MrpB subunit [Sanguibacter gelidistatuariae]|uniref:Multisubunit sodium/proton antiporter, MrpA subunit /multisubunit sodium/proton antiporter, MrpB subunit n=1 Tax=Sanguibacter gelidistatuariae TaxID=1814289 RepID=A0A1G6HBV1_9MICO|nr:Na+/H+ antiporter subunit A [Sanguibacter gelidistatuariae]SDB91568.1 multisubunit sodium/proton antiporter, MrpA subunit /multisubunit sodium/proton antiporter, MrpB subunit [Sanguibacter gelidistatuariae]
MLLLLVAHAVLALAAPALVSWMGRRAFLVMAIAPASAAIYALSWTGRVMNGEHPTQVVEWIPTIGLSLSFRMDTLTWLMLLLVGGVGALVLVYCSAYFAASASGLRKFGGVLTAFAGAMVGLVTADDMLLMFMFWELTTVFSYLLIGHYHERKASRRAAMQAIIVTTAGGLAMLVGVVILGQTSTTGYSLSGLLANPPEGTAVTAAVVCLLVGAASKAALIPTHFWLPAAMAAPTPVSAYLHAAAMVKAGVYLVARFAPAYSHLSVWVTIVVAAGCGTLLLGGYRALRQNDLKLILAYGTVSQLGLIVLLVGLGSQAAALAGLAMIGAHAMFKAALFLTVGIVDAATGTRDLRRLTGVGRAMPLTAVAGVLATASMIGFPPLAGYVAKEAALEALVHDGVPVGPSWLGTLVVAAVAVGSLLTVAYGLRFVWGAFATKKLPPAIPIAPYTAEGHVVETTMIDPAHIKRQSPLLIGPALTLAVLGLVTAAAPSLGEKLLAPHAASYGVGEPGHLTLWGGVGPALLLTVAILGLGGVLFWQRRTVERFQASLPHPVEADRVYRRSMRLLDDFAADVTAVTQRGSLPFYLGAILIVLVIGPGGVLLAQTSLPEKVRLWDNAAQVAPVIIIVVASILAARSRRRLKAVLIMGFAGYSVAFLFLLHGAPDLALTQVLVETVTLVVMVLVLRRLPPYFSDRPLAMSRWVRLGIAVAVGIVVMGLALIIPGARMHEAVSANFPEEAYKFGGGKNIVNVTLVDIRAWDTMGEISVLLVAATGVASLVFLSRRGGEIFRAQNVIDDTSKTYRVWAAQTEADAPAGVPAFYKERFTARAATAGLSTAAEISAAAVAAASAEKQAAPQRQRVWLPAGKTLAPLRRSVIFEVVTRLLFHSMIIFAVFLLFSGHNAPGGGFAAGIVVGIALIVRYLAGGRYELGEALPVQPGVLLGTGLFLSAGVGLGALILGGEVLQSVIVQFDLPAFGQVKLVTSLFFDLGVFLVVIGLILDILRSLGAEIDRQIDIALPESSLFAAVTKGGGTTAPATAMPTSTTPAAPTTPGAGEGSQP